MKPGALLFCSLLVPLLVGGCARAADDPDDHTAPAPVFVSQRAEFEAVAEALEAGENPFHGRQAAQRLAARLASPDLLGRQRLDVELELADKLLEQGDEAGAVELLEAARLQSRRIGDGQRERAILARLAVAHLRVAEVRNCLMRHNAECCIFPLEGGALHTDREPAARARDVLVEYLRAEPDDLDARWLLNIAAMALGEWPDGVPAAQRLPASTFASTGVIGRFRDVAPQLGLDVVSLCGGVVVDDLDGDGLLDILASTSAPRGPLAMFHNTGTGFVDVSDATHASDQLGGLNLVAADYDNDGDQDVLVLRGAWLYDDGQIRNSLLANPGDGTLVDVTRALGLAEPARPTQTAAWGDFDQDGDLDLYVGNESRMPDDPRGDYPCQLFRNDAGAGFVDVAASAGVTNDLYAKGVAAGDVDDDGDLDLYVSNVGDNRLYRNDGGLRFTDVARELGVTEPAGRSFATWFFDYDNDGHLDLFVAGFGASTGDLAAEALGLPHQAVLPRLYHNEGDNEGGVRLVDVTAAVDLDHVYLPMGANFGDLDNDGWLDVYLTTGDPLFESLMPNKMLRNDEGRRFLDVTTVGGFGHLQKGHGVAFADLDHDGDQDIYHQLGGFYPADRYPNALFLNPGNGQHFLYVSLRGTTSNADAVGARLTVVVRTDDGQRSIHRAVGSVSSFGGSPRRQEIGLGLATAIERVEIVWPTGVTQVLTDVERDGWIRITEGHDDVERLPLAALDLLDR